MKGSEQISHTDLLLWVLLVLDTLLGTVQGVVEPWRVACPRQCLCELRNSSHLGTKLKTLDCSNRTFRRVPSGIPAGVESLLLQGNNIKTIQQDILGLIDLKELDLSYNSISDLGSRPPFENLTSLQHLNLDNNKIHKLLHGSFSGLKNLAKLSLSSNGISSIEDHGLAGLNHLVFLSLQRNKLTSLSKSWFAGMVDLDTLLLDHNMISTIEGKTFELLQSLGELSLMENKLKYLNNSIFRGLDKLQILRLDNNQFDKVPSKAFAYFEGLRTLSMNENPIAQLDPGAFEELYIGQITLCNMPNLFYVDQEAFSGLPDLTLLQIHDNPRLSYIDPKAFHNVPNLQYLYVHNNALKALPVTITETLPLLKEISFHNNPLQCDCNVYWIKMLLLETHTTSSTNSYQPMANKLIINSPGINTDPKDNLALNNKTNQITFTELEQYTCDTPPELNGRLLSQVPLVNISSSCPPTVIPFFNESSQKELGNSVTYECRAIGIPPPHMHWILANRKVVNNTSNDSRVRIGTNGALTVNHLKVKDAGTYTCVATNELGYDTALTQLRIHSKDVHILHKGIATNFITVTWNGTNSTVHTSNYLLLYRKSGSREEYGKIHVQPYMRTYTITNLTPETMYEFCIAYEHNDDIVKLNCLNIETKHQMVVVPRLTTLGNMSVLVALCTTITVILLTCMGIVLIRRWRRRKAYKEPGGINSFTLSGASRGINAGAGPGNIEDGKKVENLSQIPLDNLYRPPSTPLCTSRTSLISHSNA